MPPVNVKSKDKNKKIMKQNNSSINGNLSVLRNKIDLIDKQMHKLIITRSVYVKNIAREKAKYSKDKSIIYRPVREHAVLMSLLKRHRGDFPKQVLVRLWRTMIGAYISMQGDLKVSYVASLENLVKDYFGVTMKYKKTKNIKKSIYILSNNVNHILVLPLPNTNNSWWKNLLNVKNVNIIGQLYDNTYKEPRGLILGSQEIEYFIKSKVIYIIVIKKSYEKSFIKYLSINSYSIFGKANIKSNEIAFLLEKEVVSHREVIKQLNNIRNSINTNLINAKIIGAVPKISKERN